VEVIGAEELSRLLPMIDAIDALDAAFGTHRPTTPLRSQVDMGDGSLLLMPAFGPEGAGVKLITFVPGNPGMGLPLIQGAYVIFSPDTRSPEAVIDGAALTGLRTAAVSGLATRYLAGPEASSLVIFGAGTQAHTHLEAMIAARPIEQVTVVSRTSSRAESLAAHARKMGLEGMVGDPFAVAGADVVCTCTTSPDPVVDGDLLQPGAHVNAVGAFRPETRELDDVSVARGRVVVEEREAALEEAGDLLIPIDNGKFSPDDIAADLSEVVAGTQVRRNDDDITVFKSVGIAFEDLAIARAAVKARGG
jgi:ornithine cyclodeaminase/alanine dehydrogenase-like protein (mu-crystallin family)